MKYPGFLYRWNAVTVGIIGVCLLIFGIGACGILLPKMLKNLVKKQLTILPGTDVRPIYMKLPFFLDFRVYMFNLTNPDEVANGGKPKVEEIGPYFFEEWKEKWDPMDDDEEDTLTYHYKNTLQFRPGSSGPGLTGNEIITMPHPLIAPMLLTLNVDKKPMIPMAKEAIDIIFDNPKNMFYTGRVMDILFDGIPIHCSDDMEFQAKAVCSVLDSDEVKSVRKLNDTHHLFSLLTMGNDTDIGEMTVYRGKKNYRDLGKVVRFNGEPEMDFWDGDECNQFVGTDSTIFPPYMDVEDGIWAYEAAICRSLGARYVGKSKYKGVKTAEFDIDIGSEENSSPCFCREHPDDCPAKGTFDMFPCIGTPMFGSQPHFYGADRKLVENFAFGINPNKEKHAMYMHFDTMTGTPMSAAKRLQFNLEMVPIEEVPYMANIQEMYYPLFWVEEAASLDKDFVKQVKMVVMLPKLISGLKWLGIIFGLYGIILSGFIFYVKSEAEEVRKIPSPINSVDIKPVE